MHRWKPFVGRTKMQFNFMAAFGRGRTRWNVINIFFAAARYGNNNQRWLSLNWKGSKANVTHELCFAIREMKWFHNDCDTNVVNIHSTYPLVEVWIHGLNAQRLVEYDEWMLSDEMIQFSKHNCKSDCTLYSHSKLGFSFPFSESLLLISTWNFI